MKISQSIRSIWSNKETVTFLMSEKLNWTGQLVPPAACLKERAGVNTKAKKKVLMSSFLSFLNR